MVLGSWYTTKDPGRCRLAVGETQDLVLDGLVLELVVVFDDRALATSMPKLNPMGLPAHQGLSLGAAFADGASFKTMDMSCPPVPASRPGGWGTPGFSGAARSRNLSGYQRPISFQYPMPTVSR